MTRTNTEIVRAFIEAMNRNDFDHVYEFCDKHCYAHVAPWVGVGIRPDLSSGEHVAVLSLIPGGNASTVLKAGDEIIRIMDGHRSWETYSEIKNGAWGQGIPGTALTITVKRDGHILELPLERGIIPAFEHKLGDYLEIWRRDKLQNWPDLKVDIKLIFEKDDLVAFFAEDSGTNLEFQRAAIWSECSIYRLRDGKITEMWGAEDSYQQLTQLGYEIREPRPEPVR